MTRSRNTVQDTHDRVAALGVAVIEGVSVLGASLRFLATILINAITPPYRFGLILEQIYRLGVGSTFVVCLVGIFTGAVLAVQGEYTLSKFGATGFVGPAVALSLIRELGPVLTALMFNGRAGSAMTAELGIMKITEQVDALRAMAVDPIRYLMVPRVVAGLISVPLLTAMFNIVGIAGGYTIGVWSLDLSSGTFMNAIVQSVRDVDVISGFVKSVVFGLVVCWVSCFKGWTCGFGAVGVNRATTSAVVTSSVIILVLDYFLSAFMTKFL